jgi:hypothetical protein
VTLTRIRFAVSLFAFSLGALACRSAAERETSAEIERIGVLVRALRDAATNAKSEPLERLRAEKCTAPPACELQQICASGYGIYERAQKATWTIREALNSGNTNVAMAKELLESNEAELGRAKQLMDQCVATEGRLIREHRP